MQAMGGHWTARSIQALADLGVADHLKDGPKSAAELATTVGAHPDGLRRAMRAAASAGVFEERPDGRFELNAPAELLRTDHPGSLRAFGTFLAQPWYWSVFSLFGNSVRTGKSVFEKVHGKPAFEWFAKNPQAAEVFHRAMTGFTKSISEAVANAVDFSRVGTLVDVGGGHGQLIETLLKRFPTLKGVVFDLPEVIEGAKPRLAQAGLSARGTTAPGSFFKSVPQGSAHILKHIIHDWDDERCVTILSHCRASVPADGRLFLIEMVIPTGPEPHFAKLLDLEMLTMTDGGRERTEAEFRALLERACYRLEKVTPTKSPVSVLEAVPV